MKLKHYLAKGKEVPPSRPTSEETDWILVDRFVVSSGKVWIGDPGFAWAECRHGEGCTLKVPNGTYVVEAKAQEFGRARLVTRLRTYLQSTTGLKLGKRIGEAGTDTGQMGVSDPKLIAQALASAFGNDENRIVGAIETAFVDVCGVYCPKPKSTGCIVYVPSGYGDGGGPVWRLLASGKTVGVETAFIGPERTIASSTSEDYFAEPYDIVVIGGEDNAKSWKLARGTSFDASIDQEYLEKGRKVEITVWSPLSPVELRVRHGSKGIIQDWARMRRSFQTPKGSQCFLRKVVLPKAGKYAVEFRVNDKLFSALEFKLLK